MDLPSDQRSFATALPESYQKEFLELDSDQARAAYMNSFTFSPSMLSPSELQDYNAITSSQNQKLYLQQHPSEPSAFYLKVRALQDAQDNAAKQQELFRKQQEEYTRQLDELKRQQQQQLQQLTPTYQQQAPKQTPQQQVESWPNPPYPAPSGAYPMEWATRGPF